LVDQIFKNFLSDTSIAEVYETQCRGQEPKVSIEFEGTLSGEIIINLPRKTLDHITKKMIPGFKGRTTKKHHQDVAGEIANLITGTFANQLQFLDHNVRLSPPELDDDPITLKTFYENVNLSFTSIYGGFDIDLYYRDNR